MTHEIISLHPNALDITGHKYGRLRALHPVSRKRMKWLCLCECGNETVVFLSSLTSGCTTSCGCFQKEVQARRLETHGKSRTPEYNAYKKLIQRCKNPKELSYRNYGARGISVSPRWAESFEAFYEDMGPKPKGTSIDRIDNNGNYGPDNCRWATKRQQCNNTRRNRMIEHNGQTMTISQWARRKGLKPNTLYYRLRRGWSVKRALMTSLLVITLTGCACQGTTAVGAGAHTIKGFDLWAVADVAATSIINAEDCP